MANVREGQGRSLYEFKIEPGSGYSSLPDDFEFNDSLKPANYNIGVQLNPYTRTNKPYMSSNMRTVTDCTVARLMNLSGAIGVLHQFEPLEQRIAHVRELHEQKVDTENFPEANTVDGDNTPLIAVAVGYEEAEKESYQLFQAGARVIIFDTANGYTPSFRRKVDRAAKKIRDSEGGELPVLIAGNVATAKGAEKLLATDELDGVKLGVGSGTACITGKHGVHVPQFDVVYGSMPVVTERGKIGISDGGAKDPAGFNIALTMADLVMAGGYFAATAEAPNSKEEHEGVLYARYQGSASWEDRDERAKAHPEKYTVDRNGYRPSEGRSGLLKVQGTIPEVVHALDSSLRLDMNYVGGVDPSTGKYTLPLFRRDAILVHLSEQAQRDMNKGGNFTKIK